MKDIERRSEIDRLLGELDGHVNESYWRAHEELNLAAVKDHKEFAAIESKGKELIALIRPMIRQALGSRYTFYEIRFNNGISMDYSTAPYKTQAYLEIEVYCRYFSIKAKLFPRTVHGIEKVIRCLKASIFAYDTAYRASDLPPEADSEAKGRAEG